MAYALPVEVYEAIRKAVKDDKTAKEVAKAIEKGFEAIEGKAKEQKVVIKAELKDELRKELVTKEEFFAEIGKLEQKIETVRQEIETVRQELKGEIETVRQEIETVRQEIKGEIKELRAYLRIILLLLALGFTLFNPQFFELVKSLISLLK